MRLKQWKEFVFGHGLLLVLTIPTFVPALHEILEYHDHTHCTAITHEYHYHSATYDCSLCDYLLHLKYFVEGQRISTYDAPYAARTTNDWATQYVREAGSGIYLRGPPARD